jgi:hypothetical protein
MADHFEIGMTDPMTDGRLGTGEEVVQYGDIVTEEHKTVDEMRPDEASTTGDQNPFTIRRREEFDRRETSKGGIGDTISIGMVNRFGLVGCVVTSSEFGMFSILRIITERLFAIRGEDIVWAKIQSTQSIKGYFTIKTETTEANGGDFLAVLVQGFNLERIR